MWEQFGLQSKKAILKMHSKILLNANCMFNLKPKKFGNYLFLVEIMIDAIIL